MPLSHSLLRTWITGGVVALVVMAVVALSLRKRPRVYRAIWIVLVVVCVFVLIDYLRAILGVPVPSQSVPRPPMAGLGGRPGSDGPLLILSIPLVRIAPGLLFACGIFPPRMRGMWKAWALGTACIAVSLALPQRMIARNGEYMDDWHRMTQRRNDESAAYGAWMKLGPPDPETGPTRAGHWRYLGCFPDYALGNLTTQEESDLVRLSIGYDHYNFPEFNPDAWKWIARAEYVQAIRIRRVLTDAEIQYLTPLKRLTRLELTETPITDAGFAELVKIENLRDLDLIRVPISGEGIQAIADSPSLRRVGLRQVDISTEDQWRIPGWRSSMTDLWRKAEGQ